MPVAADQRVPPLLSFRGKDRWHFQRAALYEKAILRAFQSRGWQRCIAVDDPDVPELKWRQRLRDTLKNLNRRIRPLRIRQECDGTRLRWEVREEKA